MVFSRQAETSSFRQLVENQREMPRLPLCPIAVVGTFSGVIKLDLTQRFNRITRTGAGVRGIEKQADRAR